MSEQRSSKAFFWGFLAGAAAAAAYTLLKAPRSGRATVEQIKDRGMQLKGQAEEMAGQVFGHSQQAGSDWQGFQDWQAQAEKTAQQAQSAAEDMAQQAQSAVEDVAQQAGEQAAEAMGAAEAAADEVSKSLG